MDINQPEFVSLLQKGNRPAQEILYDELASKVLAKCKGMLHDEAKAEDIAHDIFIKIFLNVNNFRGESKLTTWIYHITYNACLEYLRKSKNISNEVLWGDAQAQVAVAEDVAVYDELDIRKLQQAMAKLPIGQQIVLDMFYKDKLQINEIAEILEIGESAVKMRTKRGREQLALLLKQNH